MVSESPASSTLCPTCGLSAIDVEVVVSVYRIPDFGCVSGFVVDIGVVVSIGSSR